MPSIHHLPGAVGGTGEPMESENLALANTLKTTHAFEILPKSSSSLCCCVLYGCQHLPVTCLYQGVPSYVQKVS